MKRLYRSPTDRVVAGVCGGLADYFHIKPIIVRLIFIFLLLPGGFPGLLPYLVIWVLIPLKPSIKAKDTTVIDL